LLGSVVIFLILIYAQRFKAKLTFIHQQYPGYKQSIPIKLFFTSNMSVILQSMLISQFYKISQILHDKFQGSDLIKLIGTWQGDRIVGGVLWYISPPENMTNAIAYPYRTFLYICCVCTLCAVFAKFWIVISKSTPMDYAKMTRKQ